MNNFSYFKKGPSDCLLVFDISVYLGFVCFYFAFICFVFASFGCVILLSETYLYAVYLDEPGLKILKITNRFSGYIR